jgi:hypothetical protein
LHFARLKAHLTLTLIGAEMSERKNLRDIGTFFLWCAGVVFVGSFAACILIQGGFLGPDVPQIFGFIAYLCGPLPIIPAVLGLIGICALGISSRMK